MEIELYELTHENLDSVSKIDRSDISEAFVDTVSTIMELRIMALAIIASVTHLPLNMAIHI